MKMKIVIATAFALSLLSANAAITANQAKNIALSAAGGGRITDFDYEHRYYEVEVKNANVEHEFKIDTRTGRILKHKIEGNNAVVISAAKAKQIALNKVGSGRVTDIDLERKSRGTSYYEVEVKTSYGVEHELKINASNGKVISHKIDD